MGLKAYRLAFGQHQGGRIMAAQGEALAVRLSIDVALALERWPGASFLVVVRLPVSGRVYMAAALTEVGGLVTYELTGTDTSEAGELLVELQAREGAALVKSQTYHVTVRPSISGGEVGDPPGPPDTLGGDHQILTNRDARDAHPMGAITGLADTLEALGESIEALEETAPVALTDAEISALFKTL